MTERDHLDPATIAALVDRTLDPAARAAAEAHLAACADCREVWVETSEMAADAASTDAANASADIVAHRPRLRRWIYAGAGLAAAAVIGVVVWNSALFSIQHDVDRLQPDDAPHRFTDGRLSAPYPWKPAPPIHRGGNAGVPASVQRSAFELQEAAERERTPSTLRAAAFGYLALGDRGPAIDALTEAAGAAPDDATIHSDLAAALLEEWRHTQEATDAARALDAASRAMVLDGSNRPGQFNLALALEAVGLAERAIEAWRRYLSIDPDSEWAAEARRRLERLEASDEAASAQLSALYAELESGLLLDAIAERGKAEGAAARRLQEITRGLERDGGDQGLSSLVRATLESVDWPEPERACLAAAIDGITMWTRAFDAGRSEEAFTHAVRAERSLRCSGLPPLEAESRRVVSLIELNRYAEAASAARNVAERARHLGFHRARARALQAEALAATQAGRFSDAVALALESVGAADAGGDIEFSAALQTHVAGLYVRQGDVRRAWAHLRLAMEGERYTLGLRRRYAILARAAIAALDLRLSAAALTLADALIARTNGWDNAVGRAFGYLKKAEALAQLGLDTEARHTLDLAGPLLQQIASPVVREDLEAEAHLTSGLIAASPERALASLDRAVSYFARTDNRIMLPPTLLARGRARATSPSPNAAEHDWLEGIRLIEDQRPEIRDAQLRISRVDRVWELFEEVIRSTARDRPLDALAAAERGRARQLLDSLSRSQRVTPLSGRALHAWIPAGADALVYSVLPEQLLVWHLTADGVTLLRRDVSSQSLERAVQRHRRGLESDQNVGASLADVLLPENFRPRELLFVFADGPLHGLPFAALQSEPGKYLIEQSVVITGFSLTSAAASTKRPPITMRRPRLAAIETAQPQLRLPALQHVRREADEFQGLHPGARVMRAAGATPDLVLALLEEATVFHFAGHAVADTVFPSRSALIIGPGSNGALRADRIAAARITPGALVILGACDTANGQLYRGEGPLAISRSFLAAGAATVIGSLWRLEDERGSRFLIDVHRALREAPSAAAALARTQRAWIRSGGPTSIWASFQAAGGMGPIEGATVAKSGGGVRQ